MPRTDIEFKTTDGVTLRGWFYQPDGATGPLPCIVMVHGFSALKEMDLDLFAERFTTELAVCCVVYDNRGYGASDTLPGQPRHEILPEQQVSDMSDAITYAQSRTDAVDPAKIAVWGSSYSGGHVLKVGAIDKRVKAVLSQASCVDGYANFQRLVRPDFAEGMQAAFVAGEFWLRWVSTDVFPPLTSRPHCPGCRQGAGARAGGRRRPPEAVGAADARQLRLLHELGQEGRLAERLHAALVGFSCLPRWGSLLHLNANPASVEAFRSYNPSAEIHRISPTPLLMTLAANDVLTPTDIALDAYARAREPKALHILPGGHFDTYSGPNFERNVTRQIAFLKEHFL